jgi:hypothetical protein
MISTHAVQLALRNRATSLSVATTGSTSLSATATGYARSSGSFITDGFMVGMELVIAGFSVGTPRVVTAVTATALTTDSPPPVQAASSGRTLSVGLPLLRAWENIVLTKIPGRPYVTEELSAGEHQLITTTSAAGLAKETFSYWLTWYGLEGRGMDAIRVSMDALRALFAPGTVCMAGSIAVEPRGDVAVTAGQIIPQQNGWAACQLTVPCRAYSRNTVAA